MKITFEVVAGLVPFQSLSTGECFIYPEPASDQVYMKIMQPGYGCISLKTGRFYEVTPSKRVRPMDCEVIVRPL